MIATRSLGMVLGIISALAAPTAQAQTCRADAFGVNINNIYYDGRSALTPELVSAIKQSGAGWVRLNILWGWTVERTPGRFDWTGLDQSLDALKAADIQVLATLNGPTPCWALPQPDNCSAPRQAIPDVTAWKGFVTTVVSRYKDQISYWEVWNEPDLIFSIDGRGVSDANRIALYRDRILAPAAQAIHAAAPRAKVVAPVISVNGPLTVPEVRFAHQLRTALGQGVGRMVDVVSLHIYAPFDAVSYGKAARRVMRESGLANAPLWLTEMGARGRPGIVSAPTSEVELQKAYLNKAAPAALESGVYQKVFWFALTDGNDIKGHPTDAYGLIDSDANNRSAWRARATFDSFQILASRSSKLVVQPQVATGACSKR